MTARGMALILLPLLLAATAAAPPEVEGLLRAGNAAYERGDYARAVALYEKAEARATDPGMVLFNLAAAHYQLARQGDGKAEGSLAQAEAAYRTCAALKGPRRAQALYGLANCLLLRGSLGKPDALVLRGAIDTYTRCLRDPACDAALAADARYNRGRARLLLLQVPPSAEGPADDPGGEDGPDQEPERPGGEKKQPGNGAGEGKQGAGAKGAENGNGQGDGKSEGSAGRVPLPPVSDRVEGPNLAKEEAELLLRRARERILADYLKHRREMKRPTAPGARDW